jgi:hypothetical protein
MIPASKKSDQMKLPHAAALVLLLVCSSSSGCSVDRAAQNRAFMDSLDSSDPCRGVKLGTNIYNGKTTTQECEELRAASNKNALLEDYRKCVDANATDPTRCSGILQGLNAYSVNVGTNRK